MENNNPSNLNLENPESNDDLLTFAAEIGSSLLIQNRELEELNKALYLKIQNITNDNISIGNQYKDLENINQTLRSRIQFLENENKAIHSKLKLQIKGENEIKDNLYLQKEKEILYLNSEILNKDNDIKKSKEKINKLSDLCQIQKNEILALQIDQEKLKKQNLTLEKLKDEKAEYRNSLENLENDFNKLDNENIELKESLNNLNETIDKKSKIISKYNSLNTGILKELEKILIKSMNINDENNNNAKKDKESLLFNININSLLSDVNSDMNEMIKYFFDITKLKLEVVLYEEIKNQELSESEENNNTVISTTTHRYHNNDDNNNNSFNNNNTASGNDETAYSHSFESNSIYNSSIVSNEVILDPQYDMKSLYSIESAGASNDEKEEQLDNGINNDNELRDENDYNKLRTNYENESSMEEKEYFEKIYLYVSKYMSQNNIQISDKLNIPVFENLKLIIRNTYLNLINVIVKSVNINQEQKSKNRMSDIDDVTSSSWLIYPLSLQYLKLLVFTYDIENSIIKKVTANQCKDNINVIKQLKDELNSIKRTSRNLEDKIKLSKLKRRSKNLNRLSQEFDSYNLRNLERQYLYGELSLKNNESSDEEFREFVSNVITKNEKEEMNKNNKLKNNDKDEKATTITSNVVQHNSSNIHLENIDENEILLNHQVNTKIEKENNSEIINDNEINEKIHDEVKNENKIDNNMDTEKSDLNENHKNKDIYNTGMIEINNEKISEKSDSNLNSNNDEISKNNQSNIISINDETKDNTVNEENSSLKTDANKDDDVEKKVIKEENFNKIKITEKDDNNSKNVDNELSSKGSKYSFIYSLIFDVTKI